MKKIEQFFWAIGNNPGKFFGVIFSCLIVFGIWMAVENEKLHKKHSEKFWIYVKEHQCKRTGFAGKDAEAIYQCDNGLWLSHEVMRFANPDMRGSR
jgi:hypothetical protein